MLNSAKQAKKCAIEILRKTDPYVYGVDENGKKLMYVFVESLKSSVDELNHAIGEIDNILLQYEETQNKKEMEDLLQQVHERLSVLKQNFR